MKRAVLAMLCLGAALAAVVLAFGQEETMPAPAQPTPEPTPEEPGPPVNAKIKTPRLVPDPALARQIGAGLRAAQRPEFPNIRILVSHGVVVMNGQVRTFQDRALAEAIARTNPGVRLVKSNIKVAPAFRPPIAKGDKRTTATVADDEKVRQAILKRLPKCPGARPSQLKVEVYNRVAVVGGWVLSEEAADCLRHTVKFTPEVSVAVVSVIVEPPAAEPTTPPAAGGEDASPAPAP